MPWVVIEFCSSVVLHQHRLAEGLRHLRADQPRDEIRRAPGRDGDDDAHRFRRIGIGLAVHVWGDGQKCERKAGK